MRQGAGNGIESSRLVPSVSAVKTAIKQERRLQRAKVGGDLAKLHLLATEQLLQVQSQMWHNRLFMQFDFPLTHIVDRDYCYNDP